MRNGSRSTGSATRRPCTARSRASETSPATGCGATRTASQCSRSLRTAFRSRYDAVRAAVGPGVTVVAATKYVSVDEMALLAEAGIEVVGENRAQDLEAKHAAFGDTFRWHFIGRLQSNKVKVVNGRCEL